MRLLVTVTVTIIDDLLPMPHSVAFIDESVLPEVLAVTVSNTITIQITLR
jgi:hypothetical protein